MNPEPARFYLPPCAVLPSGQETAAFTLSKEKRESGKRPRKISSGSVILPILLGAALAFVTQTAFAGEFEGVYRVGRVKCRVKPVKMAYEVRWLNGRGAMYFFFGGESPDGKYLFVSESGKKAKDRFLFNDSLFDKGTFIRFDGRQFPLRKALR